MLNHHQYPLPGEGYAEICAELFLPPDAPVGDVLAALARLKEAFRKRKYRNEEDLNGNADRDH